MKIIAIGRKRTVLATAGLLALVLAVAGLTLAWMGQPQCQLGGTYFGSTIGLSYSALYIPLDPAGKKAAIRLNVLSWGPDIAGLIAEYGGDGASDTLGEAAMISPDTFKWILVTYGMKLGNPPVKCMIFCKTGIGTFAGPDLINTKYTMAVFPATADADGDGLPDPDVTPDMTFQDLTGYIKRVPLR